MAWSNPTRAEVLQVALDTGETVVEAWSGWNKGAMGTVIAPMLHHTGTPWSYPRLQAPTLRTVRDGRSDLQNSLCMYYIDYIGVIYCINNRLSWHSGAGEFRGVTDGNGHFAGIEAESDGRSWTAETRESYVKLSASICRKTGYDMSWAPRHAEFALPRGRKSDFSGMDAAAFRRDSDSIRVAGFSGADMLADERQALMALRDAIFYQSSSLGTTIGLGTLIAETHARVGPINRGDSGMIELRQEVADIKTMLLNNLPFKVAVESVEIPPMSEKDKDDLATRVANQIYTRMQS